jgi:hypothetical protein
MKESGQWLGSAKYGNDDDYVDRFAVEITDFYHQEIWASLTKDFLARMDLIFLDIKHMDPVIHKQVTGSDNHVILKNAIRIARQRWPLVIRVPLIPTVNGDVENITATAAFVSENRERYTFGTNSCKVWGGHPSNCPRTTWAMGKLWMS